MDDGVGSLKQADRLQQSECYPRQIIAGVAYKPYILYILDLGEG
jgi:hypothetical protein